MLSKRKIEVLGVKSSSRPSMLKWSTSEYSWSTRISKKNPSSLIYPMYLNPLSSSFQWTSPSHIFTSFLDPAISSKLHLPINGFFQCFSQAPKQLTTLRLGEVCVWAKNLLRIWNWRDKSRGKLRLMCRWL